MGTETSVERLGQGEPLTFAVRLHDASGESRHRVTMQRATWERLRGASEASPEDVVRAAFAFLLEREPKESILGRFDVEVIPRYFPEFEERLPSYLP